MREAVIVSTARTPIGKAYRGAFNNTSGQALAGHAIRHAVQRAGVEPGEIEDCVMGNALTQGSTGGNFGRQAAMAAGLPVIATRCEGTSEAVVHRRTGCLVEPGSVSQLASAIESLVDGEIDYEQASAESIARHAERFSDDAMAAQVAEVYRELLDD